MSWFDYMGVDSCIKGQQYRFETPQVVMAIVMKWFEEDYLLTATVDKSKKPIRRTFQCAYFMGEPEESSLFTNEEIAEEIRTLDYPKGFFIGKADEDNKWYVFLAVSNPEENGSGFNTM